jgi:very-short-patch-repair endonuclease
MNLEQVADWSRKYHGLVSRGRAQAMGMSRSAWYRAVASGQLEQLYPNVARLWGAPETLPQRALAAVWAAGGDAMSSHRTSAALWNIERPESDPIDVLFPSRMRHALPAGVAIHRPRDLHDLRPILRQQVPTTNPLRMLLDLGAVDPDAVPTAMVSLMVAKVASPAAIRSTLSRHAERGRHGITALRRALEEWLDDELPPDSQLEATMARAITRHRLPAMQFHAMVCGFEVDFLVIGTNVVIECDGWASHGLQRDQFEFDRIRGNKLAAAGFVVLHITWRRLRNESAAVAEEILDVVRREAPQALLVRAS